MINSTEKKNDLNIISGIELHLTLNELKNHFRSNQKLPPRTGHLGDWVSMKNSPSSPLSFNHVVSQLELGYPLLVTSNSLENLEKQTGDLVYRPGSMIKDKNILELTTYYYKDKTWVENINRDVTFTPFLMGKNPENGQLRSLFNLHIERYREIEHQNLFTEIDFLLHRKRYLIDFTTKILHSILNSNNLKRDLTLIFSHLVYPNGKTEPIKTVTFNNQTLHINEVSYPDISIIVSEMINLLELQKNLSMDVFETRSEQAFPMISGLYIFFLESIFQADLQWWDPDISFHGIPNQIQHYHWGARRMAGIPPWNHGYFFSESVLRKMKRLVQLTKQISPCFERLEIFLLPVSIFSILSNSSDDQDTEIWSNYFTNLAKYGSFTDFHRSYLQKFFSQFSYHFHNRCFTSTHYDNRLSMTDSKLSLSLNIPNNFENVPISFLCETISYLHQLHHEQAKDHQ